jgi:hypothetical protein
MNTILCSSRRLRSIHGKGSISSCTHTHDSNCGGSKGDGNLGLADALSKTEGVLAVLDSSAPWAVGMLRGKVGDVVREGKSR